MQFARRLILLICYYKVTDDDTVDSGAFYCTLTGLAFISNEIASKHWLDGQQTMIASANGTRNQCACACAYTS